MTSLSIWFIWKGLNLEFSFGTFFFIMMIIASMAGAVISGATMRSRLILSTSGISFQGPFRGRAYAWEKVNGFYCRNGETYLSTLEHDPEKNPLEGIPLSWFARFSNKKGYLKPNSVTESIQRFAPQVFAKSDTQAATLR